MKKILLLVILVPCFVSAQVEDWYGCDLSRLGYKNNTIKFERAANGYSHQYANDPIRTIKGGSIELSSDVFSKHVYFGLDGSFLLDAATTLWMFKSKERWWKNKDYLVDRMDVFPVRLAFGGRITPYFSIYAGGQYQYSMLAIEHKNNFTNLRDVYIGGNQRGLGVHAAAAYKYFHLRYSFMYDWIRSAKTYNGTAITNEVALHIGPSKLGGFIKVNHVYKMMEGGYMPGDRTARNKNDLSDQMVVLPSEYATTFTVSVGIYAAGLFSGVSRGMSHTISETEKGLRNERNEDKKRRIEYKE